MKSIAVIDNYDSFTYNLVQYLAELGASPRVFRNDQTTVAHISQHDGLVVSPGPGTPGAAGISVQAIGELSGRFPILGVCLGHQCLAEAFGGRVVRGEPVHGKTALVHHRGTALLEGLPNPFAATRYHSLVVEPGSIPAHLEVTAWTEDGVVMAMRHRTEPTFGVQFHPESVTTPEGKRILANFLQLP